MVIMDVTELLKAHKDNKSSLPSNEVNRPLDPDLVDLGNLLLVESNELEEKMNEENLKEVARMNAQVIN